MLPTKIVTFGSRDPQGNANDNKSETMYVMIIAGPYSKDDQSSWVHERPLSSMSRERIINDIRSGQVECVQRIIRIDLKMGTAYDDTASIAKEIELTLPEHEDDRSLWEQTLGDWCWIKSRKKV
jgi:hypothetical protein